jgi:Mn-dependent DtxR family transcriptional regulator
MQHVWKTFDANEVSHSTAHHLMTIENLIEELGYARVTDVANRLGITRGSASITLKTLEKNGFIVRDVNNFLRLTARGRLIAQATRAKRRLLQQFLREILGVDDREAEIDSCKIEHLVSMKSGHQLCALVNLLTSDHPVAKEFMKTFRNYCRRECQVKECQFCEEECLFAA